MLDRYWPRADAVNACIKNEAETADISVLLAVHQPTPLVQRSAGTGNLTPTTEKELLDAFLTDNVPSGALLVPITGPSGVGKSHVIRWLDAELRRSAKRDHFHIIRVPKSASLRTVVELILEPLKEDARFAQAREELTRAAAEVSKTDAVVTFRAHLENALSAKDAQLRLELREHPSRTHLRPLIAHAKDLPRLFSDGALRDHFAEHVLSRVIARALSGRVSEIEGDEPSQFVVDDLILPTDVDLAQAAKPVRDYYQRNIAAVDRDRLRSVVDLLNSVVDQAIGNVFQLQQNTAGMTLQDIILAVREILFKDGKDLVLLIEDFAALAGIQEVLLNVCIQEGEYEGRTVRATMRTAIALTDGYLSFRDTILTRAQREWVIGGYPQTDDEIKSGVIAMVGAYLNAARWGHDALRKLFVRRDPEASLTNWLPTWQDEDLTDAESEAVRAFGYSEKGESLFPFNRKAIEKLAERHLVQGTRLVFNPRRVINEILRSTLLMRPQFEAKVFPTADFQGLRANADLLSWITQAHQPEPIARRLASLLAVWGGNPPNVAEIAHISSAIFTAFDLPIPEDLGNVAYVPRPTAPTPTPQAPSDAPTTTHAPPGGGTGPVSQDPRVVEMRTKLEAWSNGTTLEQRDANELRKALNEMLEDAIDWPSLRIRPTELRPTSIFIPQARGNPQGERTLLIATDARDENGRIRAGLLAAYRFVKINHKRWTYPEADDDYVASAALVDHLMQQVQPRLIADAKAQTGAIGRALIAQARIAGLEPGVRLAGPNPVLKTLFAKLPDTQAQRFNDSWDNMRASVLGNINDKPARDVLQSEILDRIASFQGTGHKPFAIDIVRLLEVVGRDAPDADGVEGLPDEVKSFVRLLNEARLWSSVSPVVTQLRSIHKDLAAYIDERFDKAAFIGDLQEIVRLLAATDTMPANLPTTISNFERRLTEFQQSPIKELVAKMETVISSERTQMPKLLDALGSIDLGLIARTEEFLDIASALIAAAEASVEREVVNRRDVDPTALATEISNMLSLIAGNQERSAETTS